MKRDHQIMLFLGVVFLFSIGLSYYNNDRCAFGRECFVFNEDNVRVDDIDDILYECMEIKTVTIRDFIKPNKDGNGQWGRGWFIYERLENMGVQSIDYRKASNISQRGYYLKRMCGDVNQQLLGIRHY